MMHIDDREGAAEGTRGYAGPELDTCSPVVVHHAINYCGHSHPVHVSEYNPTSAEKVLPRPALALRGHRRCWCVP